MITLFHGSNVNVPKPLVKVGREKVDFGQGFYLTKLRKQAESWTEIIIIMNRLLLIVFLSIVCIASCIAENIIRNGVPWFDTDGNIVNAHVCVGADKG